MKLGLTWFKLQRSDVYDERIYKAPIDEGQAKTVVVHGEMVNADGLAVDW